MENTQKSYILEISRWEKFLGVVMLVTAILVALFGVVFIACSSKLGESAQFAQAGTAGLVAIGILYIVVAGICCIPSCYLLKSAKALKSGLLLEKEEDVTSGLKNCKSFFKFTGIYSLIGLIAAFVILAGSFVVIFMAL